MTGRMAIVLLASLLLAGLPGCGAGDEPATSAPVQTTGRLAKAERLVRVELVAAAVKIMRTPDEPARSEPAPCREENLDPATLEPKGAELFTGGARLEFEDVRDGALAAAESRWRLAGHTIRLRKGKFPGVFATTAKGYTYSFQMRHDGRGAVLAGGTPCLPR